MKINQLLVLLLLLVNSFQIVFAQDENKTVFQLARSGNLEDFKAMIKKKPALIDAQNEQGYSPLILACYNGNDKVAEYIINHCKDINFNNGYGTALMAATIKGNLHLVNYLLEKKADVNLTDSNGTTALHYAVIFNLDAIAKQLIKSGAKYNLKDNRGKTAKDYAVLKNKTTLLNLLTP